MFLPDINACLTYFRQHTFQFTFSFVNTFSLVIIYEKLQSPSLKISVQNIYFVPDALYNVQRNNVYIQFKYIYTLKGTPQSLLEINIT